MGPDRRAGKWGLVGWHYCGLIDAPNLIARKKSRQHSGLIDGHGQPYRELQEALRVCSSQLYELATGAR